MPDDQVRLQFDLLALAWETDLTRVFTFMVATLIVTAMWSACAVTLGIAALPITPGRRRVTASTTTRAAASPPAST